MVRLILMLAMTALIGACAYHHDIRRERIETLSERYSQFDLVLAWETRVVGKDTLVEGVVKNVRFHSMTDLEIWVAVLDPAGKVAARAVSFVIPQQLSMDETAEFSLKLPIAVHAGTKLRFTYKYRGHEGGDGGLFGGGSSGGIDWMQSFETVVPAQ